MDRPIIWSKSCYAAFTMRISIIVLLLLAEAGLVNRAIASKPSATPSIQAAKAIAIAAPRPQYPDSAKKHGIGGGGVFVLHVDTKTGIVSSVTVQKSTGVPLLDHCAIDAFQKWRFKSNAAGPKVIIPITFAPYVAKASAPYSAEKQRFLVGLPPNDKFFVRVRLFDGGGKWEESLVKVENIWNGQITGTIESDLTLVTRYKTGQRLTFPESTIDNWMILRPDGTEERNASGKLLDTHTPK